MQAFAVKQLQDRKTQLFANNIRPEKEKSDQKLAICSNVGIDFSRIAIYANETDETQKKLIIGEKGDEYEKQADRIANDIVEREDFPGNDSKQPGKLRENILRRRIKTGETGHCESPDIVHEVLTTAGQPLDTATKKFMETRFGHNFNHVRIHANSIAADSSRALSAQAYTVGGDIVFGEQRYRPGSTEGKRLLAHELAHVLQQGERTNYIQRTPSAAGEGSAQIAEAPRQWRFHRISDWKTGPGLCMNPAFWVVTYYVNYDGRDIQRPFSSSDRSTAVQNVRQTFRTDRDDVWVHHIEVRLRDGVSASAAAHDLTERRSQRFYGFECFTAASLIQFAGALRGLEQTSSTTAAATFDRQYADFRIILGSDLFLRMGGAAIVANMQRLGEFSLGELLRDTARHRGLERGDWVSLDNRGLGITGVFAIENSTYLGGVRFYGHGIGSTRGGGIFTIDQYVENLMGNPAIRSVMAQRSISRDDMRRRILDQVRVRPFYRAPNFTAPGAALRP